jgi:hypothetical protein
VRNRSVERIFLLLSTNWQPGWDAAGRGDDMQLPGTIATPIHAARTSASRALPPPLISPKHPLLSKLVSSPVMKIASIGAAVGGVAIADRVAPQGGWQHTATEIGSSMGIGGAAGAVLGTFLPGAYACKVHGTRMGAIGNAAISGAFAAPALAVIGSAILDEMLGNRREEVEQEVREEVRAEERLEDHRAAP